MPDDTLTGWEQICQYLHLSRYRIVRLGYPVFCLPDSRTVWAYRQELDDYTAALRSSSRRIGDRSDSKRQAEDF